MMCKCDTYDTYINPQLLDDIPNIPIDLVYTWVDQNDPDRIKYQKMLLKTKDENLDARRYSENQELKYSIRSVQKNCPWIRKIYIVVKDGQSPKFLDFTNPRIQLVNHSEIMPHTALPSFNSVAIECCLHKIKGLSEYYMYMNDDFFIMKPVKKSDFIAYRNNKILPYINKPLENTYKLEYKDEEIHSYGRMFMNTVVLANKITNQNLYPNINVVHVPTFCYKPWEEDLEKILRSIKHKDSDLWTYTAHCKFRTNDNVAINGCLRPIFYIYKGAIPTTSDPHNIDIYLYKDKCDTDYSLDKAQFMCVNRIDDECRDVFKKFITSIFNQKSIFEKYS